VVTATFSFTYEDYVDISERTLQRLIANRGLRAFSAAVTGLLAAFLVWYLLRGRAVDRTAWLVGVFAITAVGEYVTRPARERWRIRRLLRRKIGETATLTCIVTADEAGMTFVQENGTYYIAWRDVAELSNVPEGIQIISRRGGVSMVRARAFKTPEEQAAFARYCSERRTAAARGGVT
jgi:hypothetical protein